MAVLSLREILQGVGEAPPQPFEPAPFQRDALRALESGDVIVSAPTGSGKTWIAEQEIARTLRDAGPPAGAAGPAGPRRIWYTAPLKALSNQKFRRFQSLYGEDRVGLLTGERRVNPRAPVLVATTEILRNVLYGAGRAETAPGVVVLDEAHYLADPGRGTAWEEILLLAPGGTRLLLLSATIPNATTLAAWVATVRGRRPEVITLETRPVPLAFVLTDGAGQLLPPDPARVRTRARHPRWLTAAADALVRHRLVPAIVFFPSRRECDQAARLLAGAPAAGEAERAARIAEWTARVPQLASHPLLAALRRSGVAPHHAGHLTGWRMCVEELLEAGLVRFVCATTTLAAGLDVPARTVLLSTLHRHGPAGSEPLTPTEFHQMTGRAGRRGRDTLGIAVIAAETADDAADGLALAAASPDPVTSAFAPSDAQVLNLLARTSAGGAEAMIRRSFAVFLRGPEIAGVRARAAEIPGDPLADRPCQDRLPTRTRFDDLLRRLRRARRRGGHGTDEVARLGAEVVGMPCTGCRVVDRCLDTLSDLAAAERERRALLRDAVALEDREVAEFRARAELLRDLGYLDDAWRLTAAGRTASRIRHPRMLVLAEALRTGILPRRPAALAALGGALGTERLAGPRGTRRPPGRREGIRRGTDYRRAARLERGPEVARAWNSNAALDDAQGALVALRRIVVRLNAALRDRRLPPDPLADELSPSGGGPPAALWRASAIAEWASGRPWGEITAAHAVPDGDLQRLVWQAAEILAQIEDLPEHPLAPAARAAREALLRPPVL